MMEKDGWQVTVYFCNDYVVKVLKNYEESRERIAPYLRHKGRSEEEIDGAARQAIDDVNQSLRIMRASKCPRQLVGNPEFLDARRFRQDRATNLVERIRAQKQNKSVDSAKQILEECIEFILELWRYGVYEKTYKLDNYGYVGDRMILIDFLELSDDLEFIRKQLEEIDWSRVCERYGLPETLNNHFTKRAERMLTLENFERNWRMGLEETG